MEKRVAIFVNESSRHIESCINDFLKESSGKLHDVKFNHFENDTWETYTALIIYTPEGEHEEKDESTKKGGAGDGGICGKRIALRV